MELYPIPPTSQQAPATPRTGGFLDQATPRVTPLAVTAEPVFGPPTDIAAGWDGTLWAIDGAGAPYVYDQAQKRWQFYGSGIDAIVRTTPAQAAVEGPSSTPTTGSTPGQATTANRTVAVAPALVTYAFRGPEVVFVTDTEACTHLGLKSGDVIQVPGNAEIDIVAPGCVRRFVPNLDTLGHIAAFNPGAIKLLAPADFERIAAGPAIPDASEDPTGFAQAMLDIYGRESPACAQLGLNPGDAIQAQGNPEIDIVVSGCVRRFVPDGITWGHVQEGWHPALKLLTAADFQRVPAGPAIPAISADPMKFMNAMWEIYGRDTALSPDGAAARAAGTPRLIGDVWPQLPASFKLGIDGAVEVDGVLYLFKAGRYVRADSSQSPVKVTDLQGWPRAAPWEDGLVDLVIGLTQPAGVALVRGDQFILVDLAQAAVLQAPQSLDGLLHGDLLTRVKSHQVDAVLYTAADQPITAVQGPAVLTYTNASTSQPASSQYLPAALGSSWPATWHPVLQHAPRGRMDGLWATAADGVVMHHNGSGWSATDRRAVSVASGVDGTVFCIDRDNAQQILRLDGSTWTQVAQASVPLAQVAVGDATRVWARDSGNAVHRLDQSDTNSPHLVPVPLVAQATYIDANADGTVWSCDQNGSALRFISESIAPPQAVVSGGATRVASTSFGAAHFLVQQNGTTQVHQYDSPYVFKTSRTYTVGREGATNLAQGLGRVFLLDVDRGGAPVFTIVALDAHTGAQLGYSLMEQGKIYTPPVFDPIQEVVYVGVAPLDPEDDTTGGEVRALNARNLLEVVWSYPTPAGVDAAPALSGTSLCFGDRTTTLHMLDTSAAGGKPTLRWQWQIYPPPQRQSGVSEHMIFPTPLVANEQVYAAPWISACIKWGFSSQYFLGQSVGVCSASDGSNQASGVWGLPVEETSSGEVELHSNRALALGRAQFDGNGKTALFGALDSRLIAINVQDLTGQGTNIGSGAVAFYQAADEITSSLTYADGVLWFGDKAGNLYALDENLRPVKNTPSPLGQGGSGSSHGLLTAPLPYEGRILCGVADTERPGRLLVFDPDSGSVTTLDTAQTAIASFSGTVSNGVIYAAGTSTIGGPNPSLVPQALAIRVDKALQDQRDFIIESQMMQDFDGKQTPNGVARYQTHLTIVDDLKTSRPREAVKIWADQPMTIVVDGQSYTVGPADPDYAAVQTGTDGTLTIVSGSVKGDGTDKPDMFAPALRVWASFMDTHERIVVQPDREFHNRLATASALPASDPAHDDPTRVNLQAASTYGNQPLFTASQQQQGAPQQVAQAIQSMTKAIGVRGTGGGSVRATAWVRSATDTPGRYIAYDDLPGAGYSAVNVRTTRPAAVVQTIGFHLSTGHTGGGPLTHTQLTPADAAIAIDQLQGTDWKRSALASQPRGAAQVRVGDAWSDFWRWLQGAAATVTDIVVSVGNDIAVGIRFVVNGIANVFTQVLQTLEDVASAVGSFFKQLAIDIENAIEALSILFNFDEIIKTHNILKQELLKVINGVTGNPAYPGFANVLTMQVKPPLDAFFKQGEEGVSATLNAFADQIAGKGRTGSAATGTQGVALTDVKGAGSTTHTAFTMQPKGGDTPVSVAPQCTWAMRKFQAGLSVGGAQTATMQAVTTQLRAGDPLEAFFIGFLQRLTGDGDLSAEWAKVQAGAGHLSVASSPSDFLRQAVAELIRVAALLVDGAMAVANAFLHGFLDLVSDLVTRLFNEQDGLLTQRIDIPVVSWLYEHVFGEPLTVLNAVLLVAAIPVTLVWRLVKGEWPSQSVNASATANRQLGAAPVVVELLGILGGIGSILAGILTAIADASSLYKSLSEGSINAIKAIVGYTVIAVSMGVAVVSFPLLTTSTPDPADWVGWGVALCIAPAGLLGVPGLFFAFNDISEGTKAVLPKIVPWIESILSLVLLATAGAAYANHQHPSVDEDVVFGYTVASTVPGLWNPLTLLGKEGELIVAAIDLVMGVAAGVLTIIKAAGGFGQAVLAEV